MESNDAFVRLPVRCTVWQLISILIVFFMDLIVGGNHQIQENIKRRWFRKIAFKAKSDLGQVLNLLAGCNVRMSDAIIANRRY